MDADDLFFTTKCQLGTLPDNEVYDKLNDSLTRSLDNMKLEKVNLFLLHSQLIEDNYKLFKFDEMRAKSATTLSCFFNAAIPAFERLQKEGKIDHWGIGGLGQEEAIIQALNHSQAPSAVQCVINPLNSAGAIGGMMNDGNKKSLAMKQFGKSITVFLAMPKKRLEWLELSWCH